jgi:hypothetical protein
VRRPIASNSGAQRSIAVFRTRGEHDELAAFCRLPRAEHRRVDERHSGFARQPHQALCALQAHGAALDPHRIGRKGGEKAVAAAGEALDRAGVGSHGDGGVH